MYNWLGTEDGKPVAIKNPAKSEVENYNYKGFFSIIVFSIVEASKTFLFVDVGMKGYFLDVGVLADTPLGKMPEENTIDIPPPKPLPGDKPVPLPHPSLRCLSPTSLDYEAPPHQDDD